VARTVEFPTETPPAFQVHRMFREPISTVAVMAGSGEFADFTTGGGDGNGGFFLTPELIVTGTFLAEYVAIRPWGDCRYLNGAGRRERGGSRVSPRR